MSEIPFTEDEEKVLKAYPKLFRKADENFINFCKEEKILEYFTEKYREKYLDGTHTDIEYTFGIELHIWRKDGEFHRLDNLPAIIYGDGTLDWYENGRRTKGYNLYHIGIYGGKLDVIKYKFPDKNILEVSFDGKCYLRNRQSLLIKLFNIKDIREIIPEIKEKNMNRLFL